MIVDSFAPLALDEVVRRLDDAQIANARVNTMADVWRHPQLAARGRWTEVDTPAGRVPALLPPFARTAGDARFAAVPALGQHTRSILRELGYDDADATRLAAEGAI